MKIVRVEESYTRAVYLRRHWRPFADYSTVTIPPDKLPSRTRYTLRLLKFASMDVREWLAFKVAPWLREVER